MFLAIAFVHIIPETANKYDMYMLNKKFSQLSGGQEGDTTLIAEAGSAQEVSPTAGSGYLTQEEMME